MKPLLPLLLLSLAPLGAFSQTVSPSPLLLNFGGKLAKPDGTPVLDATYTVKFSLYDAQTGGNLRWSETITGIQTRNGIFGTILGNLTPLSEEVFNNAVWLELKINSDSPLTPRQRLVSVAYALKANTVPDNAITTSKIADNAVTNPKIWSVDYSKITNAPTSFSPSGVAGGDLSGFYPNPFLAPFAVTTGKLALNAVDNTILRLDPLSLFRVSGGSLISSGGNVGIGGSPLARLDIMTSDLNTPPFRVVAPVILNPLLPNWSYRAPLTVFYAPPLGTSSNLDNYQISVTLDTATLISQGKLRADGGDLRFTDSEGNLLPFWIESGVNTAQTKLWVRLPTLRTGTQTIFILYGNPNATSLSNGRATFDFFDDFEEAAFTAANWVFQGSLWTVANGVLTHPTTPETSVPFAEAHVSNFNLVDGIVEASLRPLAVGTGFGKGLTARVSSPTSYYRADFETFSKGQMGILYRRGINLTGLNAVAVNLLLDTWYPMSFSLSGTTLSFTSVGKTVSAINSLYSSGSVGVAIENNMTPTGADFDNFRVRKFASVPPTVSIGEEQTSSLSSVQTLFAIQPGTGYVGIGTASPSYRLQVNGQVSASAFVTASDSRYKMQVMPLRNALEDLLNLRGVTYAYDQKQWTEKNFPGGRQIGFIAQDIESIFPELVTTDRDGYKSVNYAGVVPVLVEAVKTLKAQMEVLTVRNRELRDRISRLTDLETRIKSLEARKK